MLINMNGHFVAEHEASVSVTDGAVLFGDTLFETLKAQGQTILWQKDHLDRLEKAAALLNFPCNREALEQALADVAARLDSPCSRLRLTLSRGEFSGLEFPPATASWFCITANAYPALQEGEWPAPAVCVTAPNQRVNHLSPLPQLKGGNYADCLYAGNYARRNQAHEALFITPEGQVLEGATSNIFIRKDRTLITPPCGKLVLNGIIRQQLLSLIPLLDMQVAERNITLDDLKQADEAFITNSLIDIRPIASLDGTPLPQGETWQMLFILLTRAIRG